MGKKHRSELIQLEVLANLIYGPSYVSYEYALTYYGLIPERVFEVTSATTQKNKMFNTPFDSNGIAKQSRIFRSKDIELFLVK